MINQRTITSSLLNMSNLSIFILVVTLLFLPIVNAFAVALTLDQHDDLDSLTILGLLAAAEADIEAGRHIEPVGKNAYEKVKKILEEDENNLGAARILAKILKINIEGLQTSLNVGDSIGAKEYLKIIRKINPEAIAISDAEKRLDDDLSAIHEEVGKTEQHNLAGDMVKIPGGSYLMGTLEGRKDEKPQHIVTVSSFEIGKYEVTVGQFKKFIEATGYLTDAETNAGIHKGCFGDGGGVDFGQKEGLTWRNPSYAQSDDHPVVCVSLNDAHAYIDWLNKETGSNYSLPSEAQWEYAARSGSTTDYHFGNSKSDLCLYANVYDEVAKDVNHYGWRNAPCSDGEAKSSKVGQYKASPFGLHDMHGNVWEWAEDCWKAGYHDAPSNGSVYKDNECEYRVTRGGSWYNIPLGVRSANRYWYEPTYRSFNLGFRLFRDTSMVVTLNTQQN
jgi:formylglycine-generating enzyme required for sulfatase activity